VQIASPARRHDILPNVLATPRSRNHVIDRLCRPTAILATVTVSGENGVASKWDGSPVGNPHELIQSNHRRNRQLHSFRPPYSVSGFQHLSFVIEDQDSGAPRTHHRKWLVGSVQHQHTRHGGPPLRVFKIYHPSRTGPLCLSRSLTLTGPTPTIAKPCTLSDMFAKDQDQTP